MRILVTGADGFIGRNVRLALQARQDVEVLSFVRADDRSRLRELLAGTSMVFHLAGVNRPQDPAEFKSGNTGLSRALAEAIADLPAGERPTVVLASSIQAALDNPYGRSKRAAEVFLEEAADSLGFALHVFRLPNVFGKWCRPDYNSVVATFCHRIARGQAIEVNDPRAMLRLVYVDDVVASLLHLLDGRLPVLDEHGHATVSPEYRTTVGELAATLDRFRRGRETLHIGPVGAGLERALYATYVSYLPPKDFAYAVPVHADPRGMFVEMLKTRDSGQFSFFTAHPGITRGGHYHHTKTEKFLVLSGQASFRFRHMLTGQLHELVTRGEQPQVVETIPGWTHDITNVGTTDLIVMLWANELFDPARPDTFACKL